MTLVFKQMKKMPSSLIFSKLQISTTVKYHFSPTRLSETKKFDTLCWKGEIGSYIHFLVGQYIDSVGRQFDNTYKM